jgi:hypothetical protein
LIQHPDLQVAQLQFIAVAEDALAIDNQVATVQPGSIGAADVGDVGKCTPALDAERSYLSNAATSG